MAGMTLRYSAFSVESVVDWSLDAGFLENGAFDLTLFDFQTMTKATPVSHRTVQQEV